MASTLALVKFRTAAVFLFLIAAAPMLLAQTESPAPSVIGAPVEEAIVPTFETQKLARTYVLDIPGGAGKVPVGPVYLRPLDDARYEVEDPNGGRCVYPPGNAP